MLFAAESCSVLLGANSSACRRLRRLIYGLGTIVGGVAAGAALGRLFAAIGTVAGALVGRFS